jgi:hypothetical protein
MTDKQGKTAAHLKAFGLQQGSVDGYSIGSRFRNPLIARLTLGKSNAHANVSFTPFVSGF